MELRKISERISYLPATNEPLSADVSIIHGDKFDWIFDVGTSVEALKVIESIDKEKNIVISHFHEDHTGNLEKVSCSNLYCGDYTFKKFQKGTVITEQQTFDDGVRITLFPLPSLHSKGSIGLLVDDEFVFMGDDVYGMRKNGKLLYNLNFLQEMIDILDNLKAEKVLLSHDPKFIKDKGKVIEGLKQFYDRRNPGDAYIEVSD